ncbi:amidase [Candidatus Puniceispirillum sp.]|nr:amidase [Candidatus Puniceispirillum sp.]
MTYLIKDLTAQLELGTLTARKLLDDCLAAIDKQDGEGTRAFIKVYHDRARLQANDFDKARKEGWSLPTFAGIPLSIKDLFDEEGIVTRAGSKVLNEAAPAKKDATVLTRLKAAGFIVIGRTNMTEFAFSGIGTNAHYGDPRSPFERDKNDIHKGRVAGGSSSGSAVSISDHMAAASIGSDTGGSTRTPAAFCGIVGFKPTTTRIPSEGVYPLSQSFDAAGPMANSVSCCAILDSLMAGGPGEDELHSIVKGLRLAIPKGYLFEDLDPHVAHSFDCAIDMLAAAGAEIVDVTFAAIENLRPSNNPKSIVAAEAYQVHKTRLESGMSSSYDPFVAYRLQSGKNILASEYIEMFETRKQVWAEVQAKFRGFDALVLPTAPILPPKLSSLTNIESKILQSAKSLRNTSVFNYLDRPTISIPCHEPGTGPVGLSLVGSRQHDRRLLAIAKACEATMAGE